MTALGAMVFIAITGLFFSAALLIIKGGRAEHPRGLQPSLQGADEKPLRRAR